MRRPRVMVLIGLMRLSLMICGCRHQGSTTGESLDTVKEQQKPTGEQPPPRSAQPIRRRPRELTQYQSFL
jgi:hypothetical protein